MSFLDSLFSGARALVRAAQPYVGEVVRGVFHEVRGVIQEIDRTSLGRATTALVRGITNKYFSDARNLAEEEAELAEKFRRDGVRSEKDEERLHGIQRDRDRLRAEMDEAKTRGAAIEFEDAKDEVVAKPITHEEVSGSSGVISSKQCPSCGGTMRIRQGGYNAKKGSRSFFWGCTSRLRCPAIAIDISDRTAAVIRKPDPDLDGSESDRRRIWASPEVLKETHIRLRKNLGEEDQEMVCTKHLVPMVLAPLAKSSGRLLDGYAYVCPCINDDGTACTETVRVESFPQISGLLRRREGRGILDAMAMH